MNRQIASGFVLAWLGCGGAIDAGAADASDPRGVTVSIYDAGFALVQENRTVNLSRGDNLIQFKSLPDRLQPASALVTVLGGGPEVEWQDFRFDAGAGDAARTLRRLAGRPVQVRTDAGDEEILRPVGVAY